MQAEGQKQIERAEAQANQAKYYAASAAPAPLGSRLSVPANKKVPDGYEPVWFKNTITRARYPDFFTQLVDTDYLVFVDEDSYDSQVNNYGMCASYVKIDNDTVILPLLANYARSGTLDNVGNILNDQFQGHWHEMVYRQDSTSSGYHTDIFGMMAIQLRLRQILVEQMNICNYAVLESSTGYVLLHQSQTVPMVALVLAMKLAQNLIMSWYI